MGLYAKASGELRKGRSVGTQAVHEFRLRASG